MGLHVPPHQHLVGARALPDGSFSFEEQRPELGARIRDGDPNIGWLGDDRLTLVLNLKWPDDDPLHRNLPRWEVWRAHEQGEPTLVAHLTGQRIDGDQLLRQLAAHDSRTHDMAAELIDARDHQREQALRDARERDAGYADKLAWAVGRDLGAPAQSGRVYPTS